MTDEIRRIGSSGCSRSGSTNVRRIVVGLLGLEFVGALGPQVTSLQTPDTSLKRGVLLWSAWRLSSRIHFESPLSFHHSSSNAVSTNPSPSSAFLNSHSPTMLLYHDSPEISRFHEGMILMLGRKSS